MTADIAYSVAALVTTPEVLADFARGCATDIMWEHYRYHVGTRYSDDALARRAERDIVGDLEADVSRLGFTHTPEEAASYRRIYIQAFIAAWHDQALHAEMRARLKRSGFVIICCR